MLRVALGLVVVANALAGNVVRDPATGKWVEMTSTTPDPRLSERGEGGPGSGLFGDIFGGPADNLDMEARDLPKKAARNTPLPHVHGVPSIAEMAARQSSSGSASGRSLTSSASVQSKVAGSHPTKLGVTTRSRKSKTDKYTAEIPTSQIPNYESQRQESPDILSVARAPAPAHGRTHERPAPADLNLAQIHRTGADLLGDMQANLQTATAASIEAGAGDGVPTAFRPPNQVEYVEHKVQESTLVELNGALPTTVIGTLCRFTGFAPLEDCPAEAPNGCVDRQGCSRTCVVDGYFNWRCVGPNEITADAVNEGEEVEEEVTSDEQKTAAENALASQLQAALSNSDFQHLARLILESGPTASAAAARMASKHHAHSSVLAKAVASLSQKSVAIVNPKPLAPPAPQPAAAHFSIPQQTKTPQVALQPAAAPGDPLSMMPTPPHRDNAPTQT